MKLRFFLVLFKFHTQAGSSNNIQGDGLFDSTQTSPGADAAHGFVELILQAQNDESSESSQLSDASTAIVPGPDSGSGVENTFSAHRCTTNS